MSKLTVYGATGYIGGDRIKRISVNSMEVNAEGVEPLYPAGFEDEAKKKAEVKNDDQSGNDIEPLLPAGLFKTE